MQEQNVIKLLKSDLKFSDSSIGKLRIFVKSVIDANKEHNLISKNTEMTYGIVIFLTQPS